MTEPRELKKRKSAFFEALGNVTESVDDAMMAVAARVADGANYIISPLIAASSPTINSSSTSINSPSSLSPLSSPQQYQQQQERLTTPTTLRASDDSLYTPITNMTRMNPGLYVNHVDLSLIM